MTEIERYVDAGRLLLATRLLPDITHLAVGNGVVSGTPPLSATLLTQEIGRVRYTQRFFVEEDPAGTLIFLGALYRQVPGPTNHIYLRWHFEAAEAIGTWTELGIFGGDVLYISRGAVLVDGPQAGDDRANTASVGLSGGYLGPIAQTITCTVVTGGGSGVAVVEFNGLTESGGIVPVFGTPMTLGGLGLALTFSGGVDSVLTVGDQWLIHATPDPVSGTFAAGGIYHPTGNPGGQVQNPGTLLNLTYVTPGVPKPNAILDVQRVVSVLSLPQS